MAVSNGTITGVTELRVKSSTGTCRKMYLMTVNFPSAYTGSTDTANISGVGAAVLAHTRNGKTVTLRGAVPCAPGSDGAQDVYFTGTAVQALTVSTDALTGQLSDITATELTSAAANTIGVEIAVIVDEA